MKNVALNNSKFAYRFTPKNAGEYKVTARFKGNKSNLGNKSMTSTIRVR